MREIWFLPFVNPDGYIANKAQELIIHERATADRCARVYATRHLAVSATVCSKIEPSSLLEPGDSEEPATDVQVIGRWRCRH